VSTLFIFGAGGHAKVCISVALTLGHKDINVIGTEKDPETILGFIVYREPSSLQDLIHQRTDKAFVAIGDNLDRKNKLLQLSAAGFEIASLISPQSILQPHTTVGLGTIVMPGSIVMVGSHVGSGVIVNTASSVDHDCVLGDYSHVAPNATLTGGCQLGEGVLFGAGATAVPNTKIGDGSTIGAGAVVTKDVPSFSKYVGSPARAL
jgi:sugar O-acyltransferase (sialic acid O-acetyltransferase NeuD family)